MASADLSFRPGTEADVAPAAAVQCASALVGYADIFPADAPKPTPASLVPMWADILRWTPPGVVTVAERGDHVIGVAVAHVPSGTDVGAISRIYVLPEAWAAGVGSCLLAASIDVVREQGATRASLWVLEHNQRARAWYARRGWSRTGAEWAPFPDLDLVEYEYLLEL